MWVNPVGALVEGLERDLRTYGFLPVGQGQIRERVSGSGARLVNPGDDRARDASLGVGPCDHGHSGSAWLPEQWQAFIRGQNRRGRRLVYVEPGLAPTFRGGRNFAVADLLVAIWRNATAEPHRENALIAQASYDAGCALRCSVPSCSTLVYTKLM